MIFSNYKRQFKNKLNLKVILVISVITVIGLAAGVKYWYGSNLRALNPADDHKIEFVIEFGDGVTEIAKNLVKEDLIRNAAAFVWYAKGEKATDSIQAGTYELSPAMSVATIVGLFTSGEVSSRLVTLLPGRRLDETVLEFEKAGWAMADIEAALSPALYDHPILQDLPATATLEGYIFPDSYEVNDTTTPEKLINRSLDNFYGKLIDRGLEDKLKSQGLNLHEAITLASIIAKESSDPEIQKQIAQVFLKRLRDGIVLGSDVTFLYAAAVLGVEPAVNIDSPYNTRIKKGLPPGPIANFNIAALEAVADPKSGDYLYFVAGDDGIVYFSRTLDEHNNLVAEHCIQLCQ